MVAGGGVTQVGVGGGWAALGWVATGKPCTGVPGQRHYRTTGDSVGPSTVAVVHSVVAHEMMCHIPGACCIALVHNRVSQFTNPDRSALALALARALTSAAASPPPPPPPRTGSAASSCSPAPTRWPASRCAGWAGTCCCSCRPPPRSSARWCGSGWCARPRCGSRRCCWTR